MANSKNVNPLAHAAAAVVENDPELKARIRRLINAAVSDAEHLLMFGSASERMALMKTMVPAMLRSATASDDGKGLAEQNAAYQRMLAYQRGEVT